MSLIKEYISEYERDFDFVFDQHISLVIFGVEIEVDVFAYNDQSNHSEKAHVTMKRGDLTYACDFCDTHNYEKDFYPVTLNGQQFICFRKTLYGFTLVDADTLTEEYEYFPQSVIAGGESFIITDVKQLDGLLIFEGCYWACPDECFAFDYEKKLFLNLSKIYDIVSLDEKNSAKQITVSKQDIMLGISRHGETDF